MHDKIYSKLGIYRGVLWFRVGFFNKYDSLKTWIESTPPSKQRLTIIITMRGGEREGNLTIDHKLSFGLSIFDFLIQGDNFLHMCGDHRAINI